MYIYSDPSRATDTYALPDVEVWHHASGSGDMSGGEYAPGWYFWYCFPGCLPEGDPWGPYLTRQEAIDAAQDIYD